MAVPFAEIPGRDASSSVRGYGYQIDHTIMRWLELREGETLELECGEDIDVVFPALQRRDRISRQLIQVKDLEQNVTLRSPGAVAAVANAVLYCGQSRGENLRFCYATSAAVGVEQRSPLGSLAGIEAWQHVRERYLQGLKQILQDVKRPADLSRTVWDAFANYRRSLSGKRLAALVAVFEWLTGQPQAAAMPDEVEARLQSMGMVVTSERAHHAYQRLFLYVFKLLCRPGRKQLTVAEREAQIAAPPLTGDDLDLVSDLFARMRNDPQQLVSAIHEIGRQVNVLSSDLRQSFSYDETGASLTVSAIGPNARITAQVLYALTDNLTLEDYFRMAIDTQAEVHVPHVQGLRLFHNDTLSATLGPGSLTIAHRPVGSKVRGAFQIRGRPGRLDNLEFQYYPLPGGRVRLTNKKQVNAPLIVTVDSTLPSKEEFDARLAEEGNSGMIDAGEPAFSLVWPPMAGRTVRQVLAAHEIARALGSPCIFEIIDYETYAPAAIGHIDEATDVDVDGNHLVEALQLIQEAFPTKTFTIPKSLKEEDCRQVFKLAVIIKTGALDVPWKSAEMVFFAEFMRACPDDGVLSSLGAIMLKVEDWEDDLWGTPLRLGRVEGVFPSLRLLGDVGALVSRAEHTPDGELIEVDCTPVHPGDIAQFTFSRFAPSP